jgi:hypothetical protein
MVQPLASTPAPASLPRRAAVERRIWRLAFLLTGDAASAAVLADRIVRGQPELLTLEPARLDRAIIQHARELPARRARVQRYPEQDQPRPEGDAAETLASLLALPGQPREAWILARLDQVDELHMSRAMDCSRSAARNHLHAAEERMHARFGPRVQPMIESLRRFADSLDPGRILSVHRARRRKARLRRWLVLGGVLGILAMLAGLAALKHLPL